MLPKLKSVYERFKLKHKTLIHLVFFAYILVSSVAGSAYIVSEIQNLKSSYLELKQTQTDLVAYQENFKTNFEESLFNEHLQLQQQQELEAAKTNLEIEFEKLKTVKGTKLYVDIETAYKSYQDLVAKLTRNKQVKLDTKEIDDLIPTMGEKLINQDFADLTTDLAASIEKLDKQYSAYLATLPPPPPPVANIKGYSYQTVKIDQGTFGVYLIKMPLSEVKVKTVTANKDTCKDNCPTKSLADYVKENNGFAGMNGTYFCPPDYSSCGGKVNSYDYAVYNSSLGKWLSKSSLDWSKTGLATFNGSSAKFYKKSTEYDGDGVTAGIVNYPTLLKDGDVVTNDGDLTSYQKDVKGLRGVIGVGGSNLYLAIVTNATVPQAAYVMKNLGALHALNLDGGGSSAMYINGGYVVGPGRSLPNAIVLTK